MESVQQSSYPTPPDTEQCSAATENKHGTLAECSNHTATHPTHGCATDASIRRNISRMRRIEGQVRGIERMIAEDKYCIDILTQISAATKALHGVALGLLEDHMSHCMVDAARTSDTAAAQKVAEATAAIARLMK